MRISRDGVTSDTHLFTEPKRKSGFQRTRTSPDPKHCTQIISVQTEVKAGA
jgi:hypothetical protein